MKDRVGIAVVLVRPQQQGNVGAAARAMTNMGLAELILVEPAVDLGSTAYAFAVGAGRILDEAVRKPSLEDALAPFQRVVGTTSSRHRQLEQTIVEARRLPEVLARDPEDTFTALVFGPESSGLTTDELSLCDPLVTVPCSTAQPTLNLAQAVLIVSYELQLLGSDDNRTRRQRSRAATAAEVERLFGHLDGLFRQIGFARDDTYEAVLRDLRRLAARAHPTEREVQILHGICRRALHVVDGAVEPPAIDSSSDDE